jgi:uncharacterized protein (TIGR02145 family)
MKTIKINNLLWDTANLELNGEAHFAFDGALEAAKAAGKRLPTMAEFEALTALGNTWDYERFGRWFGEDSELKQESKMSVFFPASGYLNRYDGYGSLNYVGCSGFYWSSSIVDALSAYYLYFYNSFAYPANLDYRAWGQSVRCVRDI